MVQLLCDLIKTIRPKQTLKNLALFAPLVFSGNLFERAKFLTVFRCAFIFTILTSSIYIFNDILDLPKDRLHPFKKERPIAKGTLPLPTALFISIVGLFLAIYLAYIHNFFFFLTALSYLFLQFFYSLKLKNIAVVDILAIAGGFVLRVYAGAFAIEVHMSVWFLLCVISLALFLAAGKRRAELAILTEAPARTRKSLVVYSPALLDSYLSMFANAAWLSYALFTFFFPPPPIAKRFPFWTELPLTLAGVNKWLMITIPIVIFGIMRYLRIVHEGSWAEAPERVLLGDKALLITVLFWGIMVVGIIYGVRP